MDVNEFLDKNIDSADSDGFADSEAEGQKIKFQNKMQLAFAKLINRNKNKQ
jgi:hypothetical protein